MATRVTRTGLQGRTSQIEKHCIVCGFGDIGIQNISLGWGSDKGFELVVYELKASARRWDDNARFKRLAESFELANDLIAV